MRPRKRVAAVLAVSAAALLGALALSPGRAAKWLLPKLAPAGGSLSVADVRGDLVRGLIFDDVVWSQPGLRARARRVRARLSWTALLRRKLVLERLAVLEPDVRLEPAPLRRAAKRSSGRWQASVGRFTVEGGRLLVASASGKTLLARDLAARGRFDAGVLFLEDFRASALGETASGRGRLAVAQSALDVTLSGEIPGRLRAQGAARRWRLSGGGRWRGAAWTAGATLQDERWAGWARMTGLEPARLSPRAAGKAGALTVEVHGAGVGLSTATLAGGVTFAASERGGLRLAGRVDARDGAAAFEARLSSGASGSLRGVARLDARTLEARWTLATGPALERLGVSAASLSARGALRGPWRALAGDARVTARRLRVGRAPPVETARLELSGRPEDHGLSFSVAAGSAAARGAARGSWDGRAWRARWSELVVETPRALRAERAFTTTVAKGSASVEGLSLADGAGTRLALSAAKTGGRWRRLVADLRADLGTWADAGVWTSPLRGLVEARADVAGDLHAPSGLFEARLTSASYAGAAAGRGWVTAWLDGKVARLERLEWRLGDGVLRADGTVPLKLGGTAPQDFAVRVRARRLDASAAAAKVRALALSAPVVDADVTVRRADGEWLLEGGGRAAFAGATLPSAGVKLGAGELDFAARGDRLVITRSALSPEGAGARARLSGYLAAQGPRLDFSGERLRFDTGRGLTGETDASVAVRGGWRATAIEGTASVRRGDFTPPTKKQKARAAEATAAAAAAPRKPGPSTMDLRLVFDHGVWYKERATSVELKGDLRLKKAAYEPVRLLGTVETVRGDYSYFGRVFAVEQGRLSFVGETPMDALIMARGRWVDEPTRTKVYLGLSGTLRRPLIALTSEPPMEERDIMPFLVWGRPLYEVSDRESRRAGGAQEAANVIADYISQGLRQYLPPQLAMDVFRVNVQRGHPDVTVGRYLTRRLFVSYGQTVGPEGEKRLNTAYSLSEHVSVETQNTNQGRNVVDLLLNFGFR